MILMDSSHSPLPKHIAPLCVVPNYQFVEAIEMILESANLKGEMPPLDHMGLGNSCFNRENCKWSQARGGNFEHAG